MIHIGAVKIEAGRAGEFAATHLARNLLELGFHMGRIKTGTPPRLRASTIDFAGLARLTGDERPRPFSWRSEGAIGPQLECFVTHTKAQVHRLIKDNIRLSPLDVLVLTGTHAAMDRAFERLQPRGGEAAPAAAHAGRAQPL